MSKQARRAALAALPLLLVAGHALAAETLYIGSRAAELRDAPSGSGRVLRSLAVGSAVEVLGRQGRWVRVSASGTTGWVYRGALVSQPPARENTGQDDLFGGTLSSTVRRDQTSSARGLRGMTAEALAYANKVQSPEACRQALDQTLGRRATDEQVDEFMRKSKVGPYAEA